MASVYSKTEESYLKKVGARIRELRTETGLSQEDFGRTCELDRTYLSDVERGTRNISLLNLKKIAKALNTTPSDLINV